MNYRRQYIKLDHLECDMKSNYSIQLREFEIKWNKMAPEIRLCIMAKRVKIQNPTILVNTIVSYQHCTFNEIPYKMRMVVLEHYLDYKKTQEKNEFNLD